MLNFIIRFVLATMKLVLKITLIIGGLVFSSLAAAVVAMLSSADDDADPQHDDINQHSFVHDKNSAIQAFAAGESDEFELAHYCAMSDSEK